MTVEVLLVSQHSSRSLLREEEAGSHALVDILGLCCVA